VRELYRACAASFDRTSALYRLFGVRLAAYRRDAVRALDLRPGARVADLGCGTGLALRDLVGAVGPGGKVLGVDLTDAMLRRARRRVDRRGWRNVELVEADLAAWQPPGELDGAISVLALGLVADAGAAIRRVAAALRPGARLAVVELTRPRALPAALVELGVRINRRFGVDHALLGQTLRAEMARALVEVERGSYYAGSVEIVVGERSRAALVTPASGSRRSAPLLSGSMSLEWYQPNLQFTVRRSR